MNDTSLSQNKYRKVDTSQTALVLCLKLFFFVVFKRKRMLMPTIRVDLHAYSGKIYVHK